MADVFIGYARLDRETIEKLASAIEAAGYSVWWDRQIIAGAEFSRDIERELQAARAVIIAWSRHANASPWVKDEAAVARDQAKLVPVSLDLEPPPMGFRQYQAIDFSRWKGQPGGPAVDDLLRALQARMSGIEPEPVATVASPQATRSRKYPVVAAGIVLLGLIAGLAVFRINDAPEQAPQTVNSQDPVGAAAAVDYAAVSEPRITVAPIKVRDDDAELSNLAAALGEDIASGLSRFSYLLVAAQADDGSAAEPRARYVLEGSLRRSGATLRLTTQLLDLKSGEQIWGEAFDRAFDPAILLDTQDDLTDHVVSSVADPYGALMRHLCSGVAMMAPEQMTPYQTILRFFIYRQRIGAEDHLATRNALEHGVRTDPGNADIRAGLAELYTEEYKHDYNRLPDSLDRALATARRAVDMEPDNAYANFVLAEVHYFRQDLGAFRAAADRAIALNPRDSDAMAMIGIMMGYGGDWVRSVELTTRAMALNPNHPGWYRFNTFFNEYRQGNYEKALAIAQRINMPNYFADPYVRAITYAQLGRTREAEQALDEFRALWPGIDLGALKDQHLNKWMFAQPELIDQVVDGLRKAGLD
jgi:TolB-like protein/Tfp pilus assembly protein PilF